MSDQVDALDIEEDEDDGEWPLAFITDLPLQFHGFALKAAVENNERTAYLLTLYDGAIPARKKDYRISAESELLVLWLEEDMALAFSIRKRTRIPRNAYGWLLAVANSYHMLNAPLMGRVHVEEPEYDSAEKYLHVQFNWVLPCVVPPSSQLQLIEDALECLYAEAHGMLDVIDTHWKETGKS